MKTKPYFQMDFCWQDVKLLLQIYYNVIDFFIALDLTLIKIYIYIIIHNQHGMHYTDLHFPKQRILKCFFKQAWSHLSSSAFEDVFCDLSYV